MVVKDWSEVREGGILQGYDWLVWTITFFNSAGGLIIAVVMKYADNILKAYSQSLAIILACVASLFMSHFIPTLPFVAGTCLVIISIFLYAKYPYKVKDTVVESTPHVRIHLDQQKIRMIEEDVGSSEKNGTMDGFENADSERESEKA